MWLNQGSFDFVETFSPLLLVSHLHLISSHILVWIYCDDLEPLTPDERRSFIGIRSIVHNHLLLFRPHSSRHWAFGRLAPEISRELLHIVTTPYQTNSSSSFLDYILQIFRVCYNAISGITIVGHNGSPEETHLHETIISNGQHKLVCWVGLDR